jgi:hypothetical protein
VFPTHTADGEENIDSALRAEYARRFGQPLASRELVAYALGVLGSPRFRARHDERLKLDYPQLPWPAEYDAFVRTAAVGEQFVAALCEPRTEACPPLCAVHGELTEAIRPSALRYVAPRRRLEQDGRALLSQVDDTWWRAAVGHHGLVASALRGRPAATLGDLLQALERAALWTAAERAADALHEQDVRVDSTRGSA